MSSGGQKFIYGVTSPADHILDSLNSGNRAESYSHSSSYFGGIDGMPKVKRRRNRTNKTKATRRLNPYLLFGNDRRDEICLGNPTLSQADIMKIIAEEWRTLPNHIKERYKSQSIEQKTQLDIMENKTRKPKGRFSDLSRKRPKKALTAYMFFVQDYQPQVIKMNPTIHFNDVMKLVGEKWRSMSEEEKSPYEELSKRDQQRYIDEDKQMNGGVSTVKPKIKLEKCSIPTKYSTPTFEFFASKMIETLKHDTPEANSDQVNSAIETAWRQMSEEQKYQYFQQNELEIKDFMSIIDDSNNFEDENIEDNYINMNLENLQTPLWDITNSSSIGDNNFIISELTGIKEEWNTKSKISSLISQLSLNSNSDEEYKKLIDSKLSELKIYIDEIPSNSHEISSKIHSLRDKINSSILSELDTWLLFDSIDKLANINRNITSILFNLPSVSSSSSLNNDLQYELSHN